MGLLSTRFMAVAIILSALSLGCSTRLDRHWGEAQNSVSAMQIAHPDPVAVTDTSVDGTTAGAAMEVHRTVGGDAPAPEPSMILIDSGS